MLARIRAGWVPFAAAGRLWFLTATPNHPEYVTVEDVTEQQHGMQAQQARVQNAPVVEEPDDGRCTT